jgi:signal transduction histidine kinase
LDEDLTAIRHDRLRLTAPAVQHEINNAMMVLASNLELLARSVADGPPRRQLDRSIEASRRLEETIRGFLDAARRPATDEQKVSPALALKQALPLLRVALGARHGIDVAPHENIWECRLDRARLDLALLSLVRDAASRMTPGARIGIAVENRAATQEVALLLNLPPGAEPTAEAAALLDGAARATGGRLEAGPTLAWPKA